LFCGARLLQGFFLPQQATMTTQPHDEDCDQRAAAELAMKQLERLKPEGVEPLQ
jgi:hypothetical protein